MAALLGIASLVPAVASASCPQIGQSILKGDCSPRSATCYRWVAYDLRGTGSNRIVLMHVYHRQGYNSWAYVGSSWSDCRFW